MTNIDWKMQTKVGHYKGHIFKALTYYSDSNSMVMFHYECVNQKANEHCKLSNSALGCHGDWHESLKIVLRTVHLVS